MADFNAAFIPMMTKEGGYVLHTVKHDYGGQTFAGIARRYHPDWGGWRAIDQGNIEAAKQLVAGFYKKYYWDSIKGDLIKNQNIADVVFDYAVNAGVKTATRLLQAACQVIVDGVFGQQTLVALQQADETLFLLRFTLARITRRVFIVERDETQRKFLLGWLKRDLNIRSST